MYWPHCRHRRIILALSSACVWGSGDFSGGLATRKNNQYQVLLVVSVAGMILLAGAWLGQYLGRSVLVCPRRSDGRLGATVGIAVAVGDVSGHGMPAARTTSPAISQVWRCRRAG